MRKVLLFLVLLGVVYFTGGWLMTFIFGVLSLIFKLVIFAVAVLLAIWLVSLVKHLFSGEDSSSDEGRSR